MIHRAHPPLLLVIGYGNSLRADDGAGPAVIDRLRRLDPGDKARFATQFLSAHQLVPEMAVDVAGARITYFIDASIAQSPGSVRHCRVQPTPLGGKTTLGHRWTAVEILTLAEPLARRRLRAHAITIGAASLEYHVGLSPEVAASVEEVARLLQRHIKA